MRTALLLLVVFASCQPQMPGDEDGGTSVKEKQGTRLRRKYLVANDGTVQAGTVYFDTQLSRDCGWRDVNGRIYCIPPGLEPTDLGQYVSGTYQVIP